MGGEPAGAGVAQSPRLPHYDRRPGLGLRPFHVAPLLPPLPPSHRTQHLGRLQEVRKQFVRIRIQFGADQIKRSVGDPGCLSRIRIFSVSDPGSEFFLSRIRIKEFGYFNPNNYYLGCSSRIRILIFYPSRIPDPRVKKAPDPGSGSATLNVMRIQIQVGKRATRFFKTQGFHN